MKKILLKAVLISGIIVNILYLMIFIVDLNIPNMYETRLNGIYKQQIKVLK